MVLIRPLVAVRPNLNGRDFRIEHLLRKLWHSERTVLLRPTGSQRRKASHEEAQARGRNEVHRDLPKVAVQLAGEAETRGHTAHRGTHEVV